MLSFVWVACYLCIVCCAPWWRLTGAVCTVWWFFAQWTCWIRFESVLLMASYGHCSQCAARIRPDSIFLIQLPTSNLVLLFFQRRPGSYCAKPTWIWSGWPGQVLGKRILSGSKPVCKNQWVRFWQNANRLLPVSHFQTLLCSSTDGPDHIVQNQPGSSWVLANCVRFWPIRSSPKASQCARIIWSASGQHFQSGLNWMWIGSGMFTGCCLFVVVAVIINYFVVGGVVARKLCHRSREDGRWKWRDACLKAGCMWLHLSLRVAVVEAISISAHPHLLRTVLSRTYLQSLLVLRPPPPPPPLSPFPSQAYGRVSMLCRVLAFCLFQVLSFRNKNHSKW